MSKTANLKWEQIERGLLFNLIDLKNHSIPPDSWGRFLVTTANGQKGSVGPLIGLIEDSIISVKPDNKIFVPNEILAAMNEQQTAQLGLPTSAPVRLSIKGQGILTSPSFRFQHQLVKSDGTPIMGLKRDGVLLKLSGVNYLLLDPLFSLIEGMDAFNDTPPEDMDNRMLRWANLKPLLPDNALVEKGLKSINIVRADSFTLDIDDSGEFSPQLFHKRSKQKNVDSLEDPGIGQPVLPSAAQRDFEKRFRRQAKARRHYTTAGNWFVVVPNNLHKALEIVREKQEAPYAEKRSFLANPSAALKETLQEELSEDEIDSFFEETPEFLSQRISQLGRVFGRKCIQVYPAQSHRIKNQRINPRTLKKKNSLPQ